MKHEGSYQLYAKDGEEEGPRFEEGVFIYRIECPRNEMTISGATGPNSTKINGKYRATIKGIEHMYNDHLLFKKSEDLDNKDVWLWFDTETGQWWVSNADARGQPHATGFARSAAQNFLSVWEHPWDECTPGWHEWEVYDADAAEWSSQTLTVEKLPENGFIRMKKQPDIFSEPIETHPQVPDSAKVVHDEVIKVKRRALIPTVEPNISEISLEAVVATPGASDAGSRKRVKFVLNRSVKPYTLDYYEGKETPVLSKITSLNENEGVISITGRIGDASESREVTPSYSEDVKEVQSLARKASLLPALPHEVYLEVGRTTTHRESGWIPVKNSHGRRVAFQLIKKSERDLPKWELTEKLLEELDDEIDPQMTDHLNPNKPDAALDPAEIRIRFNDLMLEDREEKVKVANLESHLAERAKNCAGILFPFF